MNTMPAPGESDLHQVDLTKLEVPQLKELKQRMEQVNLILLPFSANC